MTTIKPLVIVVAILIVANCVLISLLCYRTFNKKHPQQQPQGPAFEYLVHELKLNPGQVKKYQALRDQHFHFTQKTGEMMRLQRDSFFDNLKNPSANPAAVQQLENRILANQGQLDSATFFHFRDFRKILNAEQATKFDGIINTVLHMMSRPPGGRPGANGPPQRPEPNGRRIDSPREGFDRRQGGTGPYDNNMQPPPYRTDSNGRPMGPPPGRVGPDGKPMDPPPGKMRPDGRPMGPPPGEGPPPGYN